MADCHPMLNCSSWPEIQFDRQIVRGTVKHVHLARWKNQFIVVNQLIDPVYQSDFDHGRRMLHAFSSVDNAEFAPITTTYLGKCDHPIPSFFTQFHPLGDALNVPTVVNDHRFAFDFLATLWSLQRQLHHPLAESLRCFQLCISYVHILSRLHLSSFGRRVMCDSNDLGKLLTQFLLQQPDRLILNDLDALPDASGQKIRCGHRQLHGNLLAPEQLQPNATYDEKIDVWRVPDVCNWFLASCRPSPLLQFLLQPLHEQSKARDPNLRVSSAWLLERYFQLNHTLFFELIGN